MTTTLTATDNNLVITAIYEIPVAGILHLESHVTHCVALIGMKHDPHCQPLINCGIKRSQKNGLCIKHYKDNKAAGGTLHFNHMYR